MAKRLTPERYEILRAHLPLEVVQHIEALEAEVEELSDDVAGLKMPTCDHCPRIASHHTCSECGVMMGDNKR